jgi:hypothetical protein
VHWNSTGLKIAAALGIATGSAYGQIDPDHRQLVQLGYNQTLVGQSPISGYAFYYYNDPGFLRTNITLRLAVAPVYVDSELGFRNALGENTDLGIGAAGGGYANSYFEMRRGHYLREESFTGHGAEVSGSVYHLFNPGMLIPLSGVFRVSPRYSVYERDDTTASRFVLPDDRAGLNTRAGLRYGGSEPVLTPELGLEVSVWYENQLRQNPETYGYNDRDVKEVSHLFWARTMFVYTFPESKQSIGLSLTAGSSMDADRFSAYRLGGDLPLSSEFPLILPGYYYQEISARQFVNLVGQYSLPITPSKRWSLTTIGAVADVDYLPGLEQPGCVHSGVGLGLNYKSPSGAFNFLAGYGYGFQAIRSNGRGGHSIGIFCQIDLEAYHKNSVKLHSEAGNESNGLTRFLGRLF